MARCRRDHEPVIRSRPPSTRMELLPCGIGRIHDTPRAPHSRLPGPGEQMNDQRTTNAELPRGWKTRAREICRDIIARTPDGAPVRPGDAEFVMALLARHPDAVGKTGCGVAWLTTATTGGRHFVVVRVDGSRTDFSWKECISPSSRVQRVHRAMRAAITLQIQAFRDSQEPLACALDAAHPGPYHVDHANPTFQELVAAFTAEPAIGGYDGIRLRPHRDGDVNAELEVSDAQLWQLYHQRYAILRILCQPCNCNGRRT